VDFEDHIQQMVLYSNELDVRTRHSVDKDVLELSSFFRKLFLSYNDAMRAIDARLSALEKK